MAKEKIPSTPAIRFLKKYSVNFIPRLYKYEEKGGTEVAARELEVDEHTVIKTLVMEDEKRNPFIILMHGDKLVSTKTLARVLGSKSITPCDPKVASKHTGYLVGGTSPFGTRKELPVYIEESIMKLPKVLINAGRRGLLVEMLTSDLIKTLRPKVVTVAY
ncbi:MAG: Cys-tRNA(Pro) deacylase [Deltaproteobacteria bacterium]|nr:Cys-tRNA(Pro) deacylase [Deltaproteobacteria bacterium]